MQLVKQKHGFLIEKNISATDVFYAFTKNNELYIIRKNEEQ